MLRFSSSPSGDMHIGNLRIAIFNYLLSQQRNESLIVRIEDITCKESIEAREKEILEILHLFGMEYRDVMRQNSHLKYHRTMALQLLHDKKAFNCFCSPEKNATQEGHYDGTCENLPPEETIDNPNPFVIRLKKTPTAAHDDSFVIMDADKQPTANFANAVDDMISDISMLISDTAHLGDEAKQNAIREALGYTKAIDYAYLPEMSGTLPTLKSLLEEGFLPDAIANYLINISMQTPSDIFTLKDATAWFEVEKLSTDAATFNMQTLRAINQEHLKRLDDKELSRYVGFADSDIGALAKLFLDEACALEELRKKVQPIFEPKIISKTYEKSVESLRDVLAKAPYFERFDDFFTHLKNESTLKDEELLKTVTLLLSGSEEGMEVSKLYPYLKNYLGEIIK